jgi:hypothetical protein
VQRLASGFVAQELVVQQSAVRERSPLPVAESVGSFPSAVAPALMLALVVAAAVALVLLPPQASEPAWQAQFPAGLAHTCRRSGVRRDSHARRSCSERFLRPFPCWKGTRASLPCATRSPTPRNPFSQGTKVTPWRNYCIPSRFLSFRARRGVPGSTKRPLTTLGASMSTVLLTAPAAHLAP